MPSYITVIGHTLIQPLCDLLEKLFALPVPEAQSASNHPDESGYSASTCLLLAVITESFVMRARYLSSEHPSASQRSLHKFIRARYPDFPYAAELTEVFILRDVIAHNHLWRIESTSDRNIWTELLRKDLDPLTSEWTDNKYENFVDIDIGRTKTLCLHVIPTQIDRTDTIKVLRIVTQALTYLDDQEGRGLGVGANQSLFRSKYVSFPDIIQEVNRAT